MPGDRETRCFISDQEIATAGESSTTAGHCPEAAVERPQKIRKKQPDRAANTSLLSHAEESHVQPPGHLLAVHQGGPWRRYRKIVALLDLGDKVFVASEHTSPMKRVGIRRFPRNNKDAEMLSRFQDLRHPNIVSALEAFSAAKILYIVLEDMHMPLEFIVKCPRPLASDELGVIMGQVTDGLAYLESKRLYHGSLNSNSVLVHMAGNVKLANQESCIPATSSDNNKTLDAVGVITMELMQGYALGDGKVGVKDVERWEGSDALEFLSAITSSTGPRDLRKNGFLTRLWQRESRWPIEILCDMIFTAQTTVHRMYRYEA